MKKFLFAAAVLLIGANAALAQTPDFNPANNPDDLATLIGVCEANNVVFINVQETAAETVEQFLPILPDDVKAFYRASESLFKRTAMLQRIQNDTLEATIPETLAAFPSINVAHFQSIKTQAYNLMLDKLTTELRVANPVDRKEFATKLIKRVDGCDEEFKVESTP